MKKYLFIFMAVVGIVLASCSSNANKQNEPKPIITQDELVGGVWVSAAFYSEDIGAFVPITDKSAMIGWVFDSNGVCAMMVGSGGSAGASAYTLEADKITIKGKDKDIFLYLMGYTNNYLEVVIQAYDNPTKMRCKLKKMTDN